VEGYEHHEIAEILNCSVGNSKSQLHKTKLRIRELLVRAQKETLVARRERVSGQRPIRQRPTRNRAGWEVGDGLASPLPVYSMGPEPAAIGS